MTKRKADSDAGPPPAKRAMLAHQPFNQSPFSRMAPACAADCGCSHCVLVRVGKAKGPAKKVFSRRGFMSVPARCIEAVYFAINSNHPGVKATDAEVESFLLPVGASMLPHRGACLHPLREISDIGARMSLDRSLVLVGQRLIELATQLKPLLAVTELNADEYAVLVAALATVEKPREHLPVSSSFNTSPLAEPAKCHFMMCSNDAAVLWPDLRDARGIPVCSECDQPSAARSRAEEAFLQGKAWCWFCDLPLGCDLCACRI